MSTVLQTFKNPGEIDHVKIQDSLTSWKSKKKYIYIKNQRGVSRNLCIVLLIKTSAFVLILSLRSLI